MPTMNRAWHAHSPLRCPQRATTWHLRTRCLRLFPSTAADGHYQRHAGQFLRRRAIPATPPWRSSTACSLVEQGADLLDVGGESTRPYSTPVDAAGGTPPRVARGPGTVRTDDGVPVSIDTSKAVVAAEAVAAGAEIINDVTGLEGDPDMLRRRRGNRRRRVRHAHARHAAEPCRTIPRTATSSQDIFDYLRRRRDALIAGGLDPSRICLDPGIGFGKTHEHNLTLLANCGRYHELGCPLLVGSLSQRLHRPSPGRQTGGPHGGHHRRRPGPGSARRADHPRPRRAARAAGPAAV